MTSKLIWFILIVALFALTVFLFFSNNLPAFGEAVTAGVSDTETALDEAGVTEETETTSELESTSDLITGEESIDPSEIAVHVTPAVFDVSPGEEFTMTIMNQGKYEGTFNIDFKDENAEGLLFDPTKFVMEPHSNKTVTVLVSEDISHESLPKTIHLCARRHVGTEASTGMGVVLQACAKVNISAAQLE